MKKIILIIGLCILFLVGCNSIDYTVEAPVLGCKSGCTKLSLEIMKDLISQGHKCIDIDNHRENCLKYCDTEIREILED